METIFLNNNIATNLKSSVRYTLVQKMMEENFTKWLTQSNTIGLIYKLIDDCKKPNISLSTPSPIFVTKINTLNQSQSLSQQFSYMPPISPNSSALINYHNEKKNVLQESQNDKYQTNKGDRMTESQIIHSNNIPKFYFPGDNITILEEENLINEIFNKDEISVDEFSRITVELLNFPKMFNTILFDKINKEVKNKMNKSDFIKFYKEYFQGKNPYKRFFNFIKNPNNDYILKEDFLPFMHSLLEFHPTLEFLKVYPIYQEKYSHTVIIRIFYSNDLNNNGKLSYREFRKSNIMNMFKRVCEESDLNLIREYFSYDHFYVIYCVFWKLDNNDTTIDKEAFSKYGGHALSHKVVDRIFSQVPLKFKSGPKMGFEDFVWFILSEEDKQTRTAIEYWFKIIDLDDNGIITPHEMYYFYEEQYNRYGYLNEGEQVNFNDLLCQMYDLIKPEKEYQWTIKDFMNNKQYASIFFNSLVNLYKFRDFETRDPFSIRNDLEKNPDFSDWDRFAHYEYIKLTMEDSEENQEDVYSILI